MNFVSQTNIFRGLVLADIQCWCDEFLLGELGNADKIFIEDKSVQFSLRVNCTKLHNNSDIEERNK